MYFALISCDVFVREVCSLIATSSHTIDPFFLEKGLHERPDHLRSVLQQEIDRLSSSDKAYDALLLGYALCGNAADGLIASGIPLVIPRAHDCITLFLGSRKRYQEEFEQNPGTYYYTPSAVERGYTVGSESSQSREKRYDEYVEKFGEENARFLMETEEGWTRHYTHAAWIDFPTFRFLNCRNRVEKIAQKKSFAFRELPGNLLLLERLLQGEWNNDDFVVLQPGQKITVSNDEKVFKARDT